MEKKSVFPPQLTPSGERLVGNLNSKNVSDSDLAKALGIAQPNIHTLKYKTSQPRYKTILKIANALGVNVGSLLPHDADMSSISTQAFKVYLVIETARDSQTIRLL